MAAASNVYLDPVLTYIVANKDNATNEQLHQLH